jgi:hypothetical protein
MLKQSWGTRKAISNNMFSKFSSVLFFERGCSSALTFENLFWQMEWFLIDCVRCGDHMGWLPLVGCFKLKSLLQKSPIRETIFCKETCISKEPTDRSHPIYNIQYTTYNRVERWSFAENCLFHRVLLQKRPVILRSLSSISESWRALIFENVF